MAEPIQKRVVVLGSDSHPGVTASFEWHDVSNTFNIADYECAILDLTPLADKEYGGAHHGNVPAAASVARLLFSQGGEIVIIGVPYGLGVLQRILPKCPTYSVASGQEFTLTNQDFAFYLNEVSHWDYHFELMLQSASEVDSVFRDTIFHGSKVQNVELMRDPICLTRYNSEIAVQLRLKYTIDSPPEGLRDVLSGPLIWLPPPTKITSHAAIELLLRERYGIGAEKTEPEWIEPFRLPNQIPIEERISAIAAEIQQLQIEQEEEQRRLAEERKYLKLLYENGTPLEVIVRNSFGYLGAQVDVPEDRTREDARIKDAEGRDYTVEIKGPSKSASVMHVRQAADWVTRAKAEKVWGGKGILIVNAYGDDDPDDRDPAFPNTVAEAAARLKIALMTTIDLYNAVVALQEGTFDQTRFWRIINEREGICDFPEWGE